MVRFLVFYMVIIIYEDTAKSKCSEITLNSEAGAAKSWDGSTTLKSGNVANPCGMIANSWIQGNNLLLPKVILNFLKRCICIRGLVRK